MRHDYIRFDKKNLSPDKNGFLNLEVRAATVGVYKYRRADGSIRRELRLPEEVFSEKSMASLARKPLTFEHQGGLVNSATVSEFTVGSVGDNVRQDGKFLACGIGVHKKDAVKSVMDAKTLGMSPGYDCDIEEESSKGGKYPEHTKKYGKFDCIQRGIDYNHLTLTATPRGDGCNIRLDSDDALMIEDNSVDNNHNQKDTMKIKINAYELGGERVDSETIEFPQEAESAVNTLIARLELIQGKSTGLSKERTDSVGKVEAERDGLKKDLEEANKTIEESKVRQDSAYNLEDFNTRIELLSLGKIKPADAKELDNAALSKQIVEKSGRFDSEKLDEESYVAVAIDMLKEREKGKLKAEDAHFDSFEDLNNKQGKSQADRAAMVN